MVNGKTNMEIGNLKMVNGKAKEVIGSPKIVSGRTMKVIGNRKTVSGKRKMVTGTMVMGKFLASNIYLRPLIYPSVKLLHSMMLSMSLDRLVLIRKLKS